MAQPARPLSSQSPPTNRRKLHTQYESSMRCEVPGFGEGVIIAQTWETLFCSLFWDAGKETLPLSVWHCFCLAAPMSARPRHCLAFLTQSSRHLIRTPTGISLPADNTASFRAPSNGMRYEVCWIQAAAFAQTLVRRPWRSWPTSNER